MTDNKKKEEAISRIQNGTRDTAMAFSAFRKADTRLATYVREGRELGMTEQEIHIAISTAARRNPRSRDAIIEYSEWLLSNAPPNTK